MNNSEYTITMPYREFEKCQKLEKDYKNFKTIFESCFKVDELKETVDVESKDLIKLFKNISPERFKEYNFAVRS